MTKQAVRRSQRKIPLVTKKRDVEECTLHAPMRMSSSKIKRNSLNEKKISKRRFTICIPNKVTFQDQMSKTATIIRPNDQISVKYIEQTPNANVGEICAFCSKYNNKTSMHCRDCTAVAHLTCIQANNGQYLQGGERNWLCPNCDTCFQCYETGLNQPVYKCSHCFKSYHSTCHMTCDVKRTASSTKSKQINELRSRSQSIACIGTNGFIGFDLKDINSEVNSVQTIPLKEANSVQFSTESKTSSVNEICPSKAPSSVSLASTIDSNGSIEDIPDITSWTMDEIYNYFHKYFPNDAKVFKEQEIDGVSLLLMNRSDVLSLNMKLGTALKMFHHVMRLQSIHT